MKPRFTAWLLVLMAALSAGWAGIPADHAHERPACAIIRLRQGSDRRIARVAQTSDLRASHASHSASSDQTANALSGIDRVLFQRPPPVLLSRV